MEEEQAKVDTATTENAGQEQVNKGKTYTQEEVNRIVSERLAREKKKQPTQQVDDTSSWKKEKAQLMTQMARYEKQIAQSGYHIKPEFLDYVDYKVSHNTNKSTSYQQALKAYLEDEANKIYLEADESAKVSMPRPKNANTMNNEKVANDKLRKWAGLK